MILSDYLRKKDPNEKSEIIEYLPKTEKALCQILTRIEIKGKRDRNVPVLLTPTMRELLDLMLSLRKEVGVSSENNYLFASCTHGAKYSYRGADCLRKFSIDCGAIAPETLRSTKLRKHVASLSQILNLKNNELDLLAKFMGHDIRIHREFYRLPDNVMQVAKLSKVLIALEKGQLIN